MSEPRVACRTPAEGRDGVINIPEWKFDLLREAILKELAAGDVAFADLKGRLASALDPADRARLGSLGWHATVVKLEMEVRGEVARIAQPGPQVMTRGPDAPSS